MKILFIYPNSGSQTGFNYGVAQMAAHLEQAGHETVFLHLCEDIEPLPNKEQFLQRVGDLKPDIIGFSVVTNQWPLTAEVAGWCRDELNIPLVCGGVHATVAGRQVLETGLFDYIMVGECEDAVVDFLDRLAEGKSVRDVANLGMVLDGKIVINPVRPLPQLNEFPPKNYEIFDFQKIIDAKDGWVGLMASRGCPYNCTYCFNHVMVKQYCHDLQCSVGQLKYIRHHTVEQVIDEIKYLEKNYKNIKMYIFDDDLFIFNKKFVMEFCRQYKKISSMPFVVNGHVGLFDEERARALADANCYMVKFGVESGSEKIRTQIMHRKMSNRMIADAIAMVHQYFMQSSCFIMFGLPHETIDDVMDTVKLMSQTLPSRFRWTYFYPFPGTEAHRMSVEGGFVDKDKIGSLMNFTDSSCLDFGKEQNLFLEKIGRLLPWFVNAYSNLEVASFYREKIEELMAMDQDKWQSCSPSLHDLDKKYSARFAEEGKKHYAVKYNPFMGVMSS